MRLAAACATFASEPSPLCVTFVDTQWRTRSVIDVHVKEVGCPCLLQALSSYQGMLLMVDNLYSKCNG